VDQTKNPKYMPHHDPQESDIALLVQDRPQDEFIWQRSPTVLKGGKNGKHNEYQSVDVFLPYWLGRQSNAIPS